MDYLASFGFWLIGGGISVVLSIFSALALPVWNFSFLLGSDFSALAPVINAAAWAIDFQTINTAFGIAVTSLMAYTIAVFYWNLIGRQFISGNAIKTMYEVLGKENFLGYFKDMIFKFFGIPS